ncbi:hypothetical protein MTCD1_01554 [Colwellia marinimaniae]|uniref:Uncharacterized protein n=2 Tax=Colwelliaceae TaxID=267889 RepID=A0ABQ0MUA0_9GAMM|nr:hypothetical protein MTCD1_01554 [Colwellia marinimaniae]
MKTISKLLRLNRIFYNSLAQLSMQQQNYKEALVYLNKWRDARSQPLKAPKELTGTQEMLLAQVFYQDNDFVNS